MAEQWIANATEAEQAVLGAALLGGPEGEQAALTAAGILTAQDFYLEPHRMVWEAVEQLVALQTPVNELEVRQQLRAAGRMQATAEALRWATEGLPDVAHLEHYARKVAGAAQARRVHQAARELVVALEAGRDLQTVMGHFEATAMARNLAAVDEHGPEPFETILDRFLDGLEERKGKPRGLPTRPLDRILEPMEPDALYILAGGPSSGKSTLMDQMAWETVKAGGRVILFTLEMSKEQRMARLLPLVTAGRVPSSAIKSGDLTPEQLRQVREARRVVNGGWLIDDHSATKPGTMFATVKAEQLRHRVDLVVVDYLQIMDPDRPAKVREREVADISAGLRRIARDLRLPVLAGAQLNRSQEAEKRPPQLRDLRESGRIEQDAHAVVMLHRDLEALEERGGHEVVAYVRKQRNGPADGVRRLKLHPDAMRFLELVDQVDMASARRAVELGGEAAPF